MSARMLYLFEIVGGLAWVFLAIPRLAPSDPIDAGLLGFAGGFMVALTLVIFIKHGERDRRRARDKEPLDMIEKAGYNEPPVLKVVRPKPTPKPPHK